MKLKYKISIAAMLLIIAACQGCLPIMTKNSVDVIETESVDYVDEGVKKNFKRWKKKLYSKDSNIQTAAAVSLINLEYPDAMELLTEILSDAKKDEITISVLKAFGFTGDDRALAEVISLLDNENEKLRIESAGTLGKIKTPKAHKMMVSTLLNSQKNINTRILIAQALGDVRNRDSVEPLIRSLKSDDVDLRNTAHNALVKITRQPIGKNAPRWEAWWATNKVKSREQWLEDIVEELEETIKQVEAENDFLNKEIAKKSIELLKQSSNNSDIKLFMEAAKSKYAGVRVFAANELAKRKPPEALDMFFKLMLDDNVEVRMVAARTLGEIADKKAVEPLLGAINDENVDVQVEVVKALGMIGKSSAAKELITLLDSKSTKVLKAVIESLGMIVDDRAPDYIIPLLHNNDPVIRETVAMALGKIKDTRSVEPLIRALFDKEERVRWYAADSLGKLKAGKAVAPLIVLLSDSSARVRESATAALGQIGAKDAIEHLTKMLDDPDKRVVEEASDALLAIVGGNPKDLDNLSNIFYVKKDYDRAIKIIEKQVAKYSENEEALWNSRIRLAKSCVLTGDWDRASNLYSMLVNHFQDDVDLKKELLRSMMEMKQYDRSLDLLAGWIKGPFGQKDFFWKSRLDIVAIIYGNGEYEKAKELIDKFESEDRDLGGDDLKSDFVSIRKKSLIKIKEKKLSLNIDLRFMDIAVGRKGFALNCAAAGFLKDCHAIIV